MIFNYNVCKQNYNFVICRMIKMANYTVSDHEKRTKSTTIVFQKAF